MVEKDTINLFGQDLLYKNYDCSRNPQVHTPRPPLFNLYIQVTDVCNATCRFCDKANHVPKDVALDVFKLTHILKELTERNIVARISLTGGEPLIKVDRLNQILESIAEIIPNAYVSLNTNGTHLERFEEIKYPSLIKEIDISRHHYEEQRNCEVFGRQTASLKDIEVFSRRHKHVTLKLNCVMTKNRIYNISDVEQYLETMSQYSLKEVRFISLLNLTEAYQDLYFDVNTLTKHFSEKYANIGDLFDKDICQCFGFMYVASNGFPIKAFIRNTKKAKCNYLRQFVYTPENTFLNGFNGKIIM